MTHSRSRSIAGALVILALVLPAASAYARPMDPINAPGTDVAAPDQQAPRPVVNARGTDVAAPDQQVPVTGDEPASQPAEPFTTDGGSLGTIAVLALVVLAICIASGLVLSRKRSRATV